MTHRLKVIQRRQRRALWVLRWPRLAVLCFGPTQAWDGVGILCLAGGVGLLLYALGHWVDSSDDFLWILMGGGVLCLTLFLYGLSLFSSLAQPVTPREAESTHFFSLCFLETQQAYLVWRRRPLKRLHYLVMISTVKTLQQLQLERQGVYQQTHEQQQEEFRQLGQTFLKKYLPQAYSLASKRDFL